MQALMGLYASLATAQRVAGARVTRFSTRRSMSSRRRTRSRSPARAAQSSSRRHALVRSRAAGARSVSFASRPASVLAIVGPSGSGKSTIADLLLRLLDPDEARCGSTASTCALSRSTDLRRHVALVDQEPCHLHAIDRREHPLRASRGDRRRGARRRRGGGARRVHRTSAEGLRHDRRRARLGAVGRRAAAHRESRAHSSSNPAVLVLDEPTAALDPVSERHVVDGYEAVMRGRTTIIITHRLELARRADRVVVLDGRALLEQGSPAGMATRDGRYGGLVPDAACGLRSRSRGDVGRAQACAWP